MLIVVLETMKLLHFVRVSYKNTLGLKPEIDYYKNTFVKHDVYDH